MLNMCRWLLLAPAVALLLLDAQCRVGSADEDQPLIDSAPGRAAHADIRAWYRDREGGYPYPKALKQLASPDEAQRRWAGEYLLAFFKQTVEDERQGRTPDRGGYAIGPGPQDLGAELRWLAAGEFAKARLHGDGGDALAPALYLFRDDPRRVHSIAGMRVISKITTPEATAIVSEVVKKRHPSFEILRLGLGQVSDRRLVSHVDDVRALATHYHPDVRKAARGAAPMIGIESLPDFDPLKAFTPGLEQALRDLAAMVFTKIPKGAPWKRAEVTTPGWSEEDEPWVANYHGWVVAEDAYTIRFLTWEGRQHTFKRSQTALHSESFAEVAARVADLRHRYTTGLDEKREPADFDRVGKIGKELEALLGIQRWSYTEGQWAPTLPEGLIAAWAHKQGLLKTCADMLFPILEDTGHERALIDHFTSELAARYDATMIQAFVERDYATALRRARHLSGPLFESWHNQDRARDLAAQLPTRMETDFKTLHLPTPKEWDTLTATMARKEQIRYLAERLRLIRAEQNSIPGGVSFHTEQAKPSPDGDPWNGEALINPYSELYSMNLAAEELPLLFDTLKSGDFIRAYDMQRFGPRYPFNLYRVRWLAGALVNTSAQEQILDRALIEGGTPEELRAHLDAVATWCRAEGTVTLADRLERHVAEGKDWEDVQSAVWTLTHLRKEQLRRAVAHRVGKDSEHRGDLLMLAGHLGVPEALPVARAFLGSPAPAAERGWAALVAVRFGDRAKREGVDALLAAIRAAKTPALLNSAVDTLLELEDARVDEFLARLLQPAPPTAPTLLVIQRLFVRGHPGARDALLDLFDGKRKGEVYEAHPWMSGDFNHIEPGTGLAWTLAAWSPELDRPGWRATKEERAKAHMACRAWIADAFRRIKAGEAVPIELTPPAEPYVSWSGSGRWIRRL